MAKTNKPPVAGFEALVRAGIARAPQRPLPANFWDIPRASDPTGRLVEILLEERAAGFRLPL